VYFKGLKNKVLVDLYTQKNTHRNVVFVQKGLNFRAIYANP